MNVLCAGAAQGLVKALQGVFLEFTGARIDGCFGSVGAMREAFVAGAPCDVLIVTADMLADLHAAGLLLEGSLGTLGRVRTGLAIRSEALRPDVATPESLRTSLLAARAIYAPDGQRSTSGIHFAAVLRQLGITDAVAARLRSFGDCASAMREMAADPRSSVIGCAARAPVSCASRSVSKRRRRCRPASARRSAEEFLGLVEPALVGRAVLVATLLQ